MMRKRRTEITIETDRILVVRRRRPPLEEWCSRCGGLVPMITVDEAASVARVTSRTIYRWVEIDRLHYTETSDGRLLICLESIPPIEPIIG